ncbi:MAG: hypothetical protein GC131_04990 [Alphaproteobacteria bacterium]|nr:hypothetical protein [Alphaproteobacteria bacterium]
MQRLSVISLVLVLSACSSSGGREGYEYALPLTAGGRLCVIQCQQAREFCEKQCDFGRNQCLHNMTRRALTAYEAYAKQQLRDGLMVNRNLEDFEHPERCEADTACIDECSDIYRGCYTGCGGKVVPAK